MKILFLTPWYPDDKQMYHGIFIRDQAQALSSEHELLVISSKIDYQKYGLSSYTLTKSTFDSIVEFRLVIKRSLPIFNQLNYFLICRRITLQIAKSFKPDLIHGNIGYPGAFWSWLVSKRLAKPFIITEHTFIYNHFRSFLHKRLTLFSLRRAAAVITVGTRSAEEIVKNTGVEAFVVPNLVDVNKFSIQRPQDRKVTIGFSGGLNTHIKGLEVLLRVLSKVRRDYLLCIVGSGTLLEYYKKQASVLNLFSKCEFVGTVPHADIPALMHRFDFFVNTSKHETFGIAIVEALASGIPVVSFNNGGPGDFIDKSNGILVENQNEVKLKEAIEWMIDNYKSYDAEQIRKSANKFSQESFLLKMNEIYKKVMASAAK